MKKCSKCGTEYPDEVQICERDQSSLSLLPPDLPPRKGVKPVTVLLIAIAALGVVAGTIVLYGYVKIRPQKLRAEAIACSGNLKMIQGAKVVWMLESRKTEKDTPTQLDLSGAGKMMQSMPRCYGGGVYRIGAVGEPPTCSVHAERE